MSALSFNSNELFLCVNAHNDESAYVGELFTDKADAQEECDKLNLKESNKFRVVDLEEHLESVYNRSRYY